MERTTISIKKIDHVVLTSANVEKCAEFYRLLGFEVVDEGSHYEMFAGDFKINVHIQGHELMPNANHAVPGTLDICLEIAGDLLSWQERLTTHGYKTTKIASKRGAKGPISSFYVRDADLNLIELCSYE